MIPVIRQTGSGRCVELAFIRALILLGSLGAVVAHAQVGIRHPEPKSVRLNADLDRNGSTESITITFIPASEWVSNPVPGFVDYDSYRVQVGKSVLEGLGQSLHGEASVVDIESTDRMIEIAIPEWEPSDDHAVHFLRYEAGKLNDFGTAPGDSPQIDGSGVIRTECRGITFGTWSYPCSFRFYPEAGVLREVPQPFKPMQVSVRLKRDLGVTRSLRFGRAEFVIRNGEQATVDLTDDRAWYRIRTKSGRVGWFNAEDGRVRPWGTDIFEVFDGIPVAD